MPSFLPQFLNSPERVVIAIAAAGLPLAALCFYFFGWGFAFVLIPIIAAATVGIKMHQRIVDDKSSDAREASRLHLATVEALATAIDARDQVNVGHVRRAQMYAVGLGELLKLSESEIEALRTGALLHDIGKLAIPDHILNKPGKLTPGELAKTKIHPTVGAEILAKVGFRDPVVPTVKFHHEAWDGSGYPNGMAGDQIPLTARILCLADAYDTLRTARPYRPPMSREQARQTIQTESGKRFDPNLVNVFMLNLTALESEIDAAGLGYDGIYAGSAPEGTAFVEKIKLANQEVFNLYELAREFSAASSLDETLKLFADDLKKFVPFDSCAIYLMDSAHRTASAAYATGLDSESLVGRKLRLGQGATGYTLKTGETVKNAQPDLDFAHTDVQMVGRYSTLASVPMMMDKRVIGAVTIYSKELKQYGEENIRLLETISRIASDAIGKSVKHDEAQNHALTDPLTGLQNARSLQLQFDREVARTNRSGSAFQVLMLDLDGFKAVNDTFGHKVGDQLLREVSKVIKDQLRDYDFLSRYGGDEFVALVPETNTQDVAELCGRIEKAVTDFKLEVRENQFAGVGVSVGSAAYPTHGDSLDRIIVAADKVMYFRKSSRKRKAAAEKEVIPEVVETPSNDMLIVELDESHVVRTAGVH